MFDNGFDPINYYILLSISTFFSTLFFDGQVTKRYLINFVGCFILFLIILAILTSLTQTIMLSIILSIVFWLMTCIVYFKEKKNIDKVKDE